MEKSGLDHRVQSQWDCQRRLRLLSRNPMWCLDLLLACSVATGDVKDRYSSSQVCHKVEDFRNLRYQQAAPVRRNKIAIGGSFELVPMGFRMGAQILELAHEL